jgi:hypothetical protein
MLLDWPPPDHSWIGRKSRQFLPSQQLTKCIRSGARDLPPGRLVPTIAFLLWHHCGERRWLFRFVYLARKSGEIAPHQNNLNVDGRRNVIADDRETAWAHAGADDAAICPSPVSWGQMGGPADSVRRLRPYNLRETCGDCPCACGD